MSGAAPEATEDFTPTIRCALARLRAKVSIAQRPGALVRFCYNADDSSAIGRLLPGEIGMHSLEKFKPLALLLLRVALGIIFIYHGYPKLFTHTRDTMQMFEHLGFPGFFVYIAGALEFFGGIVLILGLFTRIAGLLLAGEMAIAVWRVHLPQGPITMVKNYEFPLVLAAAAFTLATVGAGLISLDHMIFGGGRRAPRRAKEKD
jgi:putative oxidoreductase